MGLVNVVSSLLSQDQDSICFLCREMLSLPTLFGTNVFEMDAVQGFLLPIQIL
jgi:hypothetical protein